MPLDGLGKIVFHQFVDLVSELLKAFLILAQARAAIVKVVPIID